MMMMMMFERQKPSDSCHPARLALQQSISTMERKSIRDVEPLLASVNASSVAINGSSYVEYSSRSDPDEEQHSTSNSNDNYMMHGSPFSVITHNQETSYSLPSLSKILIFQSTSMLIWLTDPLLSLIDMTVVGWTTHNPVMQLAAMGPATTLMDTLLYILYFLAIGMNNQLTILLGELACNQGKKSVCSCEQPQQQQQDVRATLLFRQLQVTASRFMGLAVLAGLAILLLVWTLGYKILSHFTNGDVELIDLAIGYCRIRALNAPLAVLCMVAQSFCLVTHQVSTVRKAIIAAVLCNSLGDVLLTPRMGLKGSALATVAANVSAAMILLPQVYCTMQEWKYREVQAAIVPLSISSSFYSDWQPIPFMTLPDMPSFVETTKTTFPLALTMWARMGSYCALTLRVTQLGSSALAVHNILLRVYFLLGCLSESVGQTAQTLLPAALYPRRVTKDCTDITNRLFLVSICAASLGSTTALCLLWKARGTLAQGVGMSVDDVHSASIFAAISLALHAFGTLMEGISIAKRDFGSLIKTYVISFGVHLYILRKTDAIGSIWMSLVGWHCSRIANFVMWGHLQFTEEDMTKKQLVD
jgi:Na+-driven multidrug efflux pump